MKMRLRSSSWMVAAALHVAVTAAGQEPSPSPSPAGEAAPVTVERPPAIPPAPPRTVAVPGAPPSRAGDSADAGRWKGVRALSVRAGEAEVQLADGERRHLRPGDVVGADTVERIEPGRIVLARKAADSTAAPATVVVSFDERGASRVRVYALQDPKGVAPLPVK